MIKINHSHLYKQGSHLHLNKRLMECHLAVDNLPISTMVNYDWYSIRKISKVDRKKNEVNYKFLKQLRFDYKNTLKKYGR